MAEQRKYMSGEELIRKLQEGEPDLTGIDGEEDFDLTGNLAFRYLQPLLGQKYSQDAPLKLNNSRWKGLKAPKIVLPYLHAKRTDLEGADLEEANINYGDFSGAILHGIKLTRATLEHVILTDAELNGAHLEKADLVYARCIDTKFLDTYLDRANFGNAHFERVDFEGASLLGTCFLGATLLDIKPENLKKTKLLGYIIAGGMNVPDEKVREIIREARQQVHLFRQDHN